MSLLTVMNQYENPFGTWIIFSQVIILIVKSIFSSNICECTSLLFELLLKLTFKKCRQWICIFVLNIFGWISVWKRLQFNVIFLFSFIRLNSVTQTKLTKFLINLIVSGLWEIVFTYTNRFSLVFYLIKIICFIPFHIN